jgi:putative FmdB family regulatory protein
MPIYEYQCEACGSKLEKLQKLSDDPLKNCPECEEPKLKKMVSAAVFRLKGGGWYETDFKTGDKKNVSGDSGSSESADSGSSKSADSGSSKGDSGSSKSADSGSSKSADSGSSKSADSGSSKSADSGSSKSADNSSTKNAGSGSS